MEEKIAKLATREELRALEERMDRRFAALEERIDRLHERIDTLTRWMIGLLVTIWATMVAAAIALLKILAAGG